MTLQMYKYPRTHHIEGSRLQTGDEDLDSVPFAQVAGRFLVVEEKLDGANAGISFDTSGRLLLQSRGHYLTGGPREKHFNLFKQWASCVAPQLFQVLGDRYVLYGEWLYAKHTVFYDNLPHYFHEFDILDTHTGVFLSTELRRIMLAGLPITSVPVLHEGLLEQHAEMLGLVGPSLYKSTNWRERLDEAARERGLDPVEVRQQTNDSDLMEGLYLKVEEEDAVVERYKFVRVDFLNSILDAGGHWLKRPILPNRLADNVDLFGGA